VLKLPEFTNVLLGKGKSRKTKIKKGKNVLNVRMKK
jgi:hypothetical protein